MIEGDLVRIRPDAPQARMIERADAVGRVLSNDGLRLWVQFSDPPAYAAAWPRSAFEPISRTEALTEDGCSDEG